MLHFVQWSVAVLNASFRYRKVLPAEEDHRFTSPKEHLCHSQHGSGRVSHRRNHVTQLRRSTIVCLFERSSHKVVIKSQDCQGTSMTVAIANFLLTEMWLCCRS